MQQDYFLSRVTNVATVLWHDNANITAHASFKMDMLTSEDITTILIVYQTLYPGRIIDISDLHFSIKKFLPFLWVLRSLAPEQKVVHQGVQEYLLHGTMTRVIYL